MTARDRKFLRESLELARKGWALTSPNPQVGALVVSPDGKALGHGFHVYKNKKHAEVVALEQAGEAARGATLYVSLEPCSHQGRTPPCTDAVVAAGIVRVVAPTLDENPIVSGKGFAQLKKAGLEVEVGHEFSEEAHKLNEAFFHFSKTQKPLVTLKAALTLDGKIAASSGDTSWITSKVARTHVQRVRHDQDAIMTGIGTVLTDNCLLTDRSGLPRRRPLLRVVVDSQLRLPLESRLVESFADDLLVVTTTAASPERRAAFGTRGIPIQMLDGKQERVDLTKVVRLLGERQILSVLIEAGAKLNWSALDSDVVDKTLFYYAPKILGGLDSLPMTEGVGKCSRTGAVQLSNVRTFPVGPNEFAVEAYCKK